MNSLLLLLLLRALQRSRRTADCSSPWAATTTDRALSLSLSLSLPLSSNRNDNSPPSLLS